MADQSALTVSDLFGDSDQDSLFVLPLKILPLQTPALVQARLIKNVRLQSVIEVFHDRQAGSGQLDVEDLSTEFGWEGETSDLAMLRRLALMPSYDVYSLRVLLREQGISVTNNKHLQLTPEKNRELTEYMTKFTRPLIKEIYGSEAQNIESMEGLVALFRDPDVSKARKNLQMMADTLGIGIMEVPTFLEDYGDIFLSLSYYHQCLDRIEPIIEDFLDSLIDLRNNYQLKSDHTFMQASKVISTTIKRVTRAVKGRFKEFENASQHMWDDMSAERFDGVKHLVETYHTTIGGILCGLSVKMSIWNFLFPDPNLGGPIRRSEFIMSEIRQGIENIQKIEDSAPKMDTLLRQTEPEPEPEEEDGDTIELG
ncbi:hypothetical protein [Magnetospira sp. QH-2]|uniref:hypothetical protein n=1 Tax=Magnetospira sp. (strain QH-2) TaxID=1288970 RepID=UPI0003E815D3|nr:hypothetical protein [Magnetospira sp. QH-2]CCQ72208.1 conserved protein of unknown function [Magnetospira sp. QH-2]